MSIPKPPARANRKGPPPAEADVPNALFTSPVAVPAEPEPPKPARQRNTPFNFRVEKDMARAFQRRAFDLEVDNVDLLEAMVDLYLDRPELAEAAQAKRKR